MAMFGPNQLEQLLAQRALSNPAAPSGLSPWEKMAYGAGSAFGNALGLTSIAPAIQAQKAKEKNAIATAMQAGTPQERYQKLSDHYAANNDIANATHYAGLAQQASSNKLDWEKFNQSRDRLPFNDAIKSIYAEAALQNTGKQSGKNPVMDTVNNLATLESKYKDPKTPQNVKDAIRMVYSEVGKIHPLSLTPNAQKGYKKTLQGKTLPSGQKFSDLDSAKQTMLTAQYISKLNDIRSDPSAPKDPASQQAMALSSLHLPTDKSEGVLHTAYKMIMALPTSNYMSKLGGDLFSATHSTPNKQSKPASKEYTPAEENMINSVMSDPNNKGYTRDQIIKELKNKNYLKR